MRFSISLSPEKGEVKLPYNYNYHLAAAIYSFISRSDPSLADFLHEKGFSEESKAFKLFTFSQLFASRRKSLKDRILLGGEIQWFISSPKEEFLSNLAKGILEQGFVSLPEQRFFVEKLEVLSLPEFREEMKFRVLSPIVVSTGEKEEEGAFKKKYLSPFETRFYEVLEENLRRKYRACYGIEASHDGISIEFAPDFISKRGRISKLIDYKGIKIRGWMAPFKAKGDAELIRIGYEAGFGEANSAGFGMVEVAKR